MAERERREHAEVGALLARHPELGEEAAAARLIGAAAEVAEQYGLNAGVVQDPKFLELIARHLRLVGEQQESQQPRDPFGVEVTLEALAPRKGLFQMSLANDFEGVLHDLPSGWVSASVNVRYEREPRELGGNEVASRRSTMEMLAGLGARSTPEGLAVDVTVATGPSVYSLLRQLEQSGRRGQVELVAVTVADAYQLQRRDPPENLRRGQGVDSAGGSTLRAVA